MQGIHNSKSKAHDIATFFVFIVVLLQCGSSPFKFKSFSIKFRIWNNSSSSDVLYIQASISISPKYESK